MYGSAGNIDMMSTEGFSFSPSKRRDILQHTVDNEVSALARLTIYENLLIGQKTSVRCPYLAGVRKARFDCICYFGVNFCVGILIPKS